MNREEGDDGMEEDEDGDGDELERWIISGGVNSKDGIKAPVGSWALMQRRRWDRKFTGRNDSW